MCSVYPILNKAIQYAEYNMALNMKKILITNMLFLCISNLVYANPLTLDDFIIEVLEHNPGVKRILADEEIANAKLKSSYGIEDYVLSSSLSLEHSEPDQVTGKEATELDRRKLSLSLDRKFSDTGTQLSLAYQNFATEQQPAALIAGESYYQPSLTLRLTQPLLKNAGGIQDRLNINLDKLGLELTRLSVREELENYITQLANLYLDWYLSYNEMNILKEVYEQVIEQEKVIKLKVKRQVAEQYELLRILETQQDYYSRWQQSIGKFNGLSHQMVNQLGASTRSFQDNVKPQNPSDSKIVNADKNIARQNQYLLGTSRLKKTLDILKSQQMELLNARSNAKKPELNISVGYTQHGIDESNTNAYINNQSDDYSVMLQYKQALGNRAASGKYHEQVATVKKIEADTLQRLINAKSSLDNFSAQLDKLIIAADSSSKKIQFAKRKLEQEKRLYKIGKFDLFQLLQDQKTQLESRINQIQLKIQLLKIKLNIGELLDQNLDIYSSENN